MPWHVDPRRGSNKSSERRPFCNISHATEAVPTYRCPCCRSLTLCSRAQDEICPVCYWEDDGQDDHDADQIRGGPNRNLIPTVLMCDSQGIPKVQPV
ncbi:MAG: CPCC family cysteine-rich protein [Rhodospirillales bacterium]